MKKENKKLKLNKQIVANLNDVKGGEAGAGFTMNIKLCKEVGKTIIETIILSWQMCFSGDPKGICKTDVCLLFVNQMVAELQLKNTHHASGALAANAVNNT